MALERLQKIISRSGVASRRKAEQLMLEGKVRVNGVVVRELGSKADWATSHIKVDGKSIRPPDRMIYIALHKPRGYVTTLSDPEGRPTVMDLLKKLKERVYPVGRLDFHSEGLLLLTNDGDFANRLISASSGIFKTYWVKVKGLPDEKKIERLRQGIMLDSRRTLPARIRLLRRAIQASHEAATNSWYEVILSEGRQNQIRRMFDLIGHTVQKLKRVQIGPLALGSLPVGQARHLTASEVRMLKRDSKPGGSKSIVDPSREKLPPARPSGQRAVMTAGPRPRVHSQKPPLRSKKPPLRHSAKHARH